MGRVMSKINAIDLNSREYLIPHFEEFLREVERLSKTDNLYTNYLELAQTWSTYDCFTVLIDESSEEILGFSCLQTHGYPAGVGRVLTRTYYHPKIRERSLSGRRLPSLATKLMLPLQMAVARKLQLSHIFFSMQGINRRPYFKKVVAALNEHLGNENWVVLDKLFNTCRPIPGTNQANCDQSCWQNIAYFKKADEIDLPLASMEIDKYLSIYT
jgi:hypothetical protein